MSTLLVSDRRIGGTGLAAVLGSWRRPGPAYAALADAVRRAVLAGDLPLATRVPGERELAAALGVSRTTTSGAYGVLRDEGYLVSRQGSGTVTALPADPSRGGAALPLHRPLATDGVVDLTIAACPAPRELHEAARRAVDSLPRHAGHGYAPLGLDVLREAIADRYTARGTPTTPDQVLVTTGAQHAIALLVRAHAGPGDRVVVEQPTYPHAIDAARSVGARPVPVPAGAGGTDLDLLESTVRQVAPRLVYLIPDHHNPTGATLDGAARDRVRALARRTGTVVAGDEVLTDLTLDGPAAVVVDGTTLTVPDGSTTVAEALDALDVTLQPLDRVSVQRAGGTITVVVNRVVIQDVTTTHEVPFNAVEQNDASLYVGDSKVTTAGVPGVRTVVERVTTVDGQETGREPLSDAVTQAPVDQVTNIGTKKKPVVTTPKASSSAPASAGTPAVGGGDAAGLNWAALAACESGGNPSIVSASGKYHGLYQFSVATWNAVGGSGLPSDASADEQTARAQMLYNRSGAGQWPVCGSRLFG